MTRIKGGWLAVALVAMACFSAAAVAQESKWQAEHDAGWQAYKQGHFSEAERRLRAAEGVAQALGPTTCDSPRRSTTSLGFCVPRTKPPDAESLAKRALAIREKALGTEHSAVAKSLNTLACLYDMEGKTEEARLLHERQLRLRRRSRERITWTSPPSSTTWPRSIMSCTGTRRPRVLTSEPSRSVRRPRVRSPLTLLRHCTTSECSTSTRASSPRPNRC